MLKIAPHLGITVLQKIHRIQSPIDYKVPCGSLNAAWRVFSGAFLAAERAFRAKIQKVAVLLIPAVLQVVPLIVVFLVNRSGVEYYAMTAAPANRNIIARGSYQ